MMFHHFRVFAETSTSLATRLCCLLNYFHSNSSEYMSYHYYLIRNHHTHSLLHCFHLLHLQKADHYVHVHIALTVVCYLASNLFLWLKINSDHWRLLRLWKLDVKAICFPQLGFMMSSTYCFAMIHFDYISTQAWCSTFNRVYFGICFALISTSSLCASSMLYIAISSSKSSIIIEKWWMLLGLWCLRHSLPISLGLCHRSLF